MRDGAVQKLWREVRAIGPDERGLEIPVDDAARGRSARRERPPSFIEMLKAGDVRGPGYERAFQAMLQMKKVDIAVLGAAYEGAFGYMAS